MAERVVLHVGVPKTGTSYVQDLLFNNPEQLATQGVAYPGERHDAHFLAALDLMQLTWGGLERQAEGAWDRLVEQTRAAHGMVVISHEILGFASRAHVAKALADLTEGGRVPVDLVVSARDLVRQIPAEWQENVKHRRTLAYRDFLGQLRDREHPSTVAAWFWGVQDLPAVLDRWAADLPPERVHLVTVPPPGRPRDLLWQRFTTAFGVDFAALTEGTNRDNPSLGVPETALVRRLNTHVNDVVPNERYRQFVRELLAHQTLSRDQTSARLSLPPEMYAWAADLSAAWVEDLAGRGYDVVGDLDDLLPGDALPWADPDEPVESEVADAGVKALSAMTREAARLRDVEIELHEVIAARDAELEYFQRQLGHRVRSKVVRTAESNPLSRAGLWTYRKVRGRSGG